MFIVIDKIMSPLHSYVDTLASSVNIFEILNVKGGLKDQALM